MASPMSAAHAMNPSAVAAQINGITKLNDTNFPQWQSEIRMILGVMDLDHALRENAPTAPVPAGDNDLTLAERTKTYEYEKQRWERSNRMSLMIMKNSINLGIRGAIPESNNEGVEFNARQYMASVEEHFKSSSKAHATTLIMRMITGKYNGTTGVREHIMMMVDIAAKLKGMEMEISDGYLVHFIMTSLPSQFDPFKINYNSLREKWSISDLIAMCVQEEERLKADKKDHVNHVSHGQKRGAKSKKKLVFDMKPKKAELKKSKEQAQTDEGSSKSKGPKCCFCKNFGHIQKECDGFKAWLTKRGIPFRSEAGKGGAQN